MLFRFLLGFIFQWKMRKVVNFFLRHFQHADEDENKDATGDNENRCRYLRRCRVELQSVKHRSVEHFGFVAGPGGFGVDGFGSSQLLQVGD